MNTGAAQLGFFGRVKLATLVLRGGIAEAVEHFRRSAGLGGAVKDRPERPYSQVIAVYACVRTKADALARMPLRISDANDNLIESGPLANLAEQPSAGQTGRAFWRETSALIDLFGRVHWVPVRDGAGRVTEVLVANPLQMEPVTDPATGELLAWKYHAHGRYRGQAQTLSLDEVHTIVDPDFEAPEKKWQGLGARTVAAMAIAQYYKADLANESSLDNDVEPGGVFTMEGTPTPDQVRDTREAINDRQAGVRNRRRFLLLYGGLKFERMAAAFSEMEFSQLKFMSREDVCVSFQVNPLVIGYGGREGLGSGQHIETAQEIFWDNTVLPRAEWLSEEWDKLVSRSWGNDRSLTLRDCVRRRLCRREFKSRTLRAARDHARRSGLVFFSWFDAAGISAVQRAALRLAESAGKWVERGVPLNQVLAAYDLPFEEVPWGDTWYKPFGLVDVQDEDAMLPGADDPAGPDPEDLEEASAQAPRRTAGALAPVVERRLTEAQLLRLWESWRGSWSLIERRMHGRVRRHVTGLRRETMRNLERVLGAGSQASVSRPGPERRDVIAQILFDLVEADKKLVAMARPLVRASYELGGAQSMQDAIVAAGGEPQDAKPFDIKDPAVEAAIRGREIRIKETNRTLRRRLAHELADGFNAQETTTQIAQRLRKEFNLASARARTIAMTEVGGAVEDARQQGRSQAGVPHKSWLWSRKETGREWHRDTEEITMSEPVPNDQLFTLAKTGARTPHPRGPGLTAEDAANCGCTTLSRYPGDSVRDKRLFDHLLSRGFLSADRLGALGSNPTTNPSATEDHDEDQ